MSALGNKPDPKNAVGSFVIQDIVPGVEFDVLNPNNPVFLLGLPNGPESPSIIQGKKQKTFLEVLKALNLNLEMELKTGNPDNPEEPVKLNFQRMKDFQMEEIINKVEVLKKLNTKKEMAYRLLSKAGSNQKFAEVLKDKSKIEQMKSFLTNTINLLEDE